MRLILQNIAFLILCFFFVCHGNGQKIKESINWHKFLARSDMIYDTLTTKWEEGVFTGNGLLGSMLYMKDANTLRIEIGQTDVTDHRANPYTPLYSNARLPIGHFELKPSGKILKNTARLDLWNAEATGKIVTDKGTINWRTLTLSQTDVIIFETSTTGTENNFQWTWQPEISISSRTKFSRDIPNGYQPNPQPHFGKKENIEYCQQPLLAGGDYTTAWRKEVKGNIRTFYISTSINKDESAVPVVIETINKAAKNNLQNLIAQHRQWWHQYYPQSFVSLPDARMESFYWIQQYKLASATREGKPPIDLMGPWFRYTPWPGYWFNLNIELTYSPLFTANRLSLVKSYLKMFDDHLENLSKNVPEEYRYNAAAVGRSGSIDMFIPVKVKPVLDSTATPAELETGDLTWCLYYYWLYYRYSMDENIKASLFPLLKKSINYYLDVINKGEDGKWHLPYTYSPEYPGGITRDCNFDLSLLRWGCATLLKINPGDSLAPTWKNVVNDLTDYPTDSTGLRVGRDVAFSESHRHFSHLLMIYPLAVMNWRQPENRPLITKSIDHWLSFEGALQGYTFTGAASMNAQMGNGNKALEYLNRLLDKYVKPNTMYLESGPVIETPLSAANTIQELLLQSWGDKIVIFPAVPEKWKDVSFKDLRTEGAFLISAVRKNGETRWVHIKSLAGGVCNIHPGITGALKFRGSIVPQKMPEDGLYSIEMKQGEEIILYKNEADLSFAINEVPIENGKQNYWGSKKYKQ